MDIWHFSMTSVKHELINNSIKLHKKYLNYFEWFTIIKQAHSHYFSIELQNKSLISISRHTSDKA